MQKPRLVPGWVRGKPGTGHGFLLLNGVWHMSSCLIFKNRLYKGEIVQHLYLSFPCPYSGQGPPTTAHAPGSVGNEISLKIEIPGGQCNHEFFCLNTANLLNRNKCWSADLLLNNHLHSAEQSTETF